MTRPATVPLAELSRFCAQLRFEDLPARVVARMKVHLLDTFGAALAGTRSAEFALALALDPDLAGAGPDVGGPKRGAQIWGARRRAAPREAAFLNGVAAHVFELDDTGGCDHSGAVVAPAVMAALAGAGAPVSGGELIAACVVGYEVGRRVLEAAGGYDGHNGDGWHSTGTCGAIGAAAAVARLWRLDAARMQQAITIATSFSSGLWAFIHDGAQTKKIHAGRAAEGGHRAAELARAGLLGPSRVFDDVWGGFFRSFDDAPGDPTRFTAALGEVYKLERVSLKPYASCRGAHSAVDAVDDMLIESGRAGADVAAVAIAMSPMLFDMCGRAVIEPLAAAQMSLPLAVALRCAEGEAGLAVYAEGRRRSPRVAAMLERIAVAIDEGQAAMDEPLVTLRFSDGATMSRRVPRPSGSPQRPMSETAIAAKFARLAEMALSPADAARLADSLEALDTLDDAARLGPLLAGDGASRPRFT